MAGKIFINYRRDDSQGTAGRLSDRLIETFGRNKIFMDVDHIPAGADFVTYLNEQVAASEALLVLIGPKWLDARDESGRRRLDDPDDFVAIEITAALERNIRVVPVLIDGARMPKAGELTDELKPLMRRQALEVRHSQFDRDAEALVARVHEALSSVQDHRPVENQSDELGFDKIVDNARARARLNATMAAVLAGLLALPLIHYVFPDKVVDVDIPTKVAAIPWLIGAGMLFYLTFLVPQWEPEFKQSTAFRGLSRRDRENLDTRMAGIRVAWRQPILPYVTGATFAVLFLLGSFAIFRGLFWCFLIPSTCW
jgi:TIR domain